MVHQAQTFLSEGVPLHGIGIQSHLRNELETDVHVILVRQIHFIALF